MDRRVWGIALLAIVILAAVVAPAWVGRRLAGSAERSPVPGPPRVGDCLDAVATQRSALDFLPPVLTGSTGPCGDHNYGELVAVSPDVSSFPAAVNLGTRNPEALACDPLVRDYLGWPVLTAGNEGEDRSSTFVDWRLGNTISSALLGPNIWQYLAGQEWLACVVYPDFAPFKGSIRGSARDGQSAVAFAACQLAAPMVVQPVVSCTVPHRTEILGWIAGSNPTANPIGELNASCVTLMQRLTGMGDVTADGALTVAAVTDGFDSNDPAANGATSSSTTRSQDQVACAATVTGSRRLVGTLIGIGEQKLPWE